jgi:uncharacterized membrane protein
MEFKIEKMNRMRRNILLGVLLGTVITFGYSILPGLFVRLRFRLTEVRVVLLLYCLTLLVFGVRYLLFKKKLHKNHFLRDAVNDERVKLNWLRAYRFAFLIMIIITIFWKLYETSIYPEIWRTKIVLPHGPWLIWFGSVSALVGSFLYYNREVKER